MRREDILKAPMQVTLDLMEVATANDIEPGAGTDTSAPGDLGQRHQDLPVFGVRLGVSFITKT